jgi:hypothetical protein
VFALTTFVHHRRKAEELERCTKLAEEGVREQERDARIQRSVAEMHRHNNIVILEGYDDIEKFVASLSQLDAPDARSEASLSTAASSSNQSSSSAQAAASAGTAAETSGAASKEPVRKASQLPDPRKVHRGWPSGLFPQPIQAPAVSEATSSPPQHAPSPGSADESEPAPAPTPMTEHAEFGTRAGREAATSGEAFGIDIARLSESFLAEMGAGEDFDMEANEFDIAKLTDNLIQHIAVIGDSLRPVDRAAGEVSTAGAESDLSAVPDVSTARQEAAQLERLPEQQDMSLDLEAATTEDDTSSCTISECDVESSCTASVSGEAAEQPPAASRGATTDDSLPLPKTCDAAAAVPTGAESLLPDVEKEAAGVAAMSPSSANCQAPQLKKAEGEAAATEVSTTETVDYDGEKKRRGKAAENPSNATSPCSQISEASAEATAAADAADGPTEAGSRKQEDTVELQEAAMQRPSEPEEPSLADGDTSAEEKPIGLCSAAGPLTSAEEALEDAEGEAAGSRMVAHVASEDELAEAIAYVTALAAEAADGASEDGCAPKPDANESQIAAEEGESFAPGVEAGESYTAIEGGESSAPKAEAGEAHPGIEAGVTLVVGVWEGETELSDSVSVGSVAASESCAEEAEPEPTSGAEQKKENLEGPVGAVNDVAAVAEAMPAETVSDLPASPAAASKTEGEAMLAETACEVPSSPSATHKTDGETIPAESASKVPAANAVVSRLKKKKEKRKLRAAATAAAGGSVDDTSSQKGQPKPPSTTTDCSSPAPQEGLAAGSSQVAVQQGDDIRPAEQNRTVQEIVDQPSSAAEVNRESVAVEGSESVANSSASPVETVKAEELCSQAPTQGASRTDATLHHVASVLKAHEEQEEGGDTNGQKQGGGFIGHVSSLVERVWGRGKKGADSSLGGSGGASVAPETPSTSASPRCEDDLHTPKSNPSEQASSEPMTLQTNSSLLCSNACRQAVTSFVK